MTCFEINESLKGGNKIPFLDEERYCQYEFVHSPKEEYRIFFDVVGKGGLGHEHTNNVWRTSFLAYLNLLKHS